MNSEIKKILKKIEQNGYEAYVVGGFVRDCLLGISSTDIDICTNMLPKEIKILFPNAKEIGTYGTYHIKTKRFHYDISTYRMEDNFANRHPKKIEYTSNLIEDLNRRDFTINAICMTQKGKIIDLLNGIEDIENKTLRMIGDPKKRLQEDPLRILRAIRFSSHLNFQIEETLWEEIKKQSKMVQTLSIERIKKEIDSILISSNFQKGLDLLEQANILSGLKVEYQQIKYVNDVNGMWAQMMRTEKIKFTKNESKQISMIQKIVADGVITPHTIFEYGLYPVTVAAKILEIPESQITKMYQNMPIYEPKDLKISFEQIQKLTNQSPKQTKQIQKQLLKNILNGTLKNKKSVIENFLKKNWMDRKGAKKYE